MEQQEKFNKAWEFKKQGERVSALGLYRELYNELVDEAGEHVRQVPGTGVDEGGTRKIMPSLFTEVEKYLKENKNFCVILNNMGVIYAEAGDKDSARRCFVDSIKFTRDNVNYPDPKIGIDNLK